MITVGVDEAARKVCGEALRDFNAHASPEWHALYASDAGVARPVEAYARDLGGTLLGGVYGVVRWHWFEIDVFWVREDRRGCGLGAQLLAAVERASLAEGARAAMLDTMDFQARGFYEKQGYSLFGELPDYSPSHTRYFLSKRYS